MSYDLLKKGGKHMSKRVVGGDYLLDLSSIEIEKSEDGTKTNITDADVLEQLTNLKKYVPNPQMAKPVWIKLKMVKMMNWLLHVVHLPM